MRLRRLEIERFRGIGTRCGLAGAGFDGLLGRSIDAVEPRHLAFGGGGPGSDSKLKGFVARMGRRSATEVNRVTLASFLAGEASVVHQDVLQFRDPWHGWGRAG